MFSEAIQFLQLFSPDGQKQMVEIVQTAKRERGTEYYKYLQVEYPMFPYILDLVANKTSQEAFEQICKDYSNYPIHAFRNQIFEMHEILEKELDKPRFK